MIRIKDNEIEQLKLMTEQSQTVISTQESDLKVTTLERRVEMLTAELDRINSTFLLKNKEILELKSRNFEL